MAASTSIPWRRDGVNSWNDLVQRVNQVLENPPVNTDCDPIAPLPEVNACHQWTTQDITAMQDALKEACDTNVFTSVEPCDKWKKFIIDEIEAAILIGFCDCETLDECAPPCDNQGPEEERFLLSEDVTGCTTGSFGNCLTQIAASSGLFDDYLTAESTFITSLNQLCVLIQEVEELEDELDDLTEQKDTECTANPGSALCISLTTQVDDKQEELDDKIVERDAKSVEESINRSNMIAAAAATVDNAIAAVAPGNDLSEIELVVNSPGVPWTNFECNDPLRIPACFGPVNECQATWELQRQTVFQDHFTSSGLTEDECACIDFGPQCTQGECAPKIRASGSYTIDGSVVVNPFFECLGRPTVLCICIFFEGPCPSFCGQICILGISLITNEWKLFITFPEVRGNEACNSGDPCTLDPP